MITAIDAIWKIQMEKALKSMKDILKESDL